MCTLYQTSWDASVSETDLSPRDWLTQKSKDNTVFLYWKCVIDLQIKVLLYVLSIREGNFKLQVEVLYTLLSWYFIIYEHYNYARRLTMHCFDIFIINRKFLNIYQLLSKENFLFQKSPWEFSRMDLDQIHELNNKLIKGCGGASDLQFLFVEGRMGTTSLSKLEHILKIMNCYTNINTVLERTRVHKMLLFIFTTTFARK